MGNICFKYVKTILIMLLMGACFSSVYAQFGGGSGTETDPYQVATAQHLNNIRNYGSSHFLQTADIDLNIAPYNTGMGWSPLCDATSFNGSYSGNGFSILNMYIHIPEDSYLGLFARANNAVFEDINLQNINIFGNGTWIGGLVGWNLNNAFSGCHVTGIIEGDGTYVGGLAGYSAISSQFHNCSSQVDVTGSNYVGGLVGMIEDSGISDCFTTGNIYSSEGGGGLVGYCYSLEVTSCYALGNVTAYTTGAGGLIGICEENSSINNCFARGNIEAGSYGGGLVGECYDSEITDCYAIGNITGNALSGGGLVGYCINSEITKCYALGNISENSYSGGGLIGTSEENSIVTNCFARGNVDVNSRGGGLISFAHSTTVSNCYSTGMVSEGALKGGLVGVSSSSTYYNSYWDTQTSGHSTSAGGSGRTTDELTYPYATNTYVRWGFVNIWIADTTGNENAGYPYLHPLDILQVVSTPTFSVAAGSFSAPFQLSIATETPNASIRYTLDGSDPTELSTVYTMPLNITGTTTVKAKAYRNDWIPSVTAEATYTNLDFGGGTGTSNDPFLVSTPNHLNNVRNQLNAHFRQTANLNMDIAPFNADTGWSPLGYQGGANADAFTGKYDGNGFHIENLYIQRTASDYIGLFGLTEEAVLVNVRLQDVNIQGNQKVGSLAGMSKDTEIYGCMASGSVVGTGSNSKWIGGLVGLLSAQSTLNSSSAGVIVTGCNNVGGIVGECDSSYVSNSFSTGAVHCFFIDGGGLVGLAKAAEFSFCKATGTVSEGNSKQGGLVGECLDNTLIRDCFARGNVSSDTDAGGLIGLAAQATISNCYSTGLVTGIERAGGLAGFSLPNSITGCYWDTQTSGQQVSAGGEGRTTDEMTYSYAENTYVGWNLDHIWVADTNSSVNDGYPYLGIPVPNADNNTASTPIVSMSNYPNPFSTGTTIQFSLPKAMNTGLVVYNIRGQKICTLISNLSYPKGDYQVRWDGKAEDGSTLPNGVYVLKLSGSGTTMTRKVTVLK